MKRVLAVGTVLGAVCASYFFAASLRASVPTVPSNTWSTTGELAQSRVGATAVLMTDGRVLITGGLDENANVLASAERFSPDSGEFLATSPMVTPRANHTSTVLADGRILVTGGTGTTGQAVVGSEIYDPASNSWSVAAPMNVARRGHTATMLPDGRVLIAGGDDAGVALDSLEIYDSTVDAFVVANGHLTAPRTMFAAAVVGDPADDKNTRVLMVGGYDGASPLASSDVYDVKTGLLSAGPALSAARAGLSATTLLDGKVLIIGGANSDGVLASAEIFDPATNAFVAIGSGLSAARQNHIAALLPHNNQVLIVGGIAGGAAVASAELYTPWQGDGGTFCAVAVCASGFAGPASPAVARAWAAGSALSFPAGAVRRSGPNDGLFVLTGGSGTKSSELFGFATIRTDRDDYAPGETVTITGSGWQPGEWVALVLKESPDFDEHPLLDVQADDNGNIVSTEFSPDQHDIGIHFYLTAFGQASQAQTIFSDSPKVGSVSVGAQSPSPVTGGNNATYTVTVNRGSGNGSTGAFNANLSITPPSTLPSGASASFLPNPVIFTSTDSTKTATLTISTTVSTPGGSSSFTVTATRTDNSVDNATSSPSSSLVVTAGCLAPTITTQPVNAAVTYGNDATFTAAANGTPTPTVQWQVSTDNGTTWSNIGGATTTTLTLTNPPVSASGNKYRAVFTNTCGGTQTATTSSATLTVSTKSIAATITASDKTYDGNDNATITNCTLSGVVGSDAVTCSASAGHFASANNSPSAQTVTATVTLSGAAAANYTVTSPASTSAKINPKNLTAALTASDKTYDGNDTATITGCTLSGVVGSDNVTCSGVNAHFASANASATPQTVTANVTLSGSAAGNYTVTSPATTSAKISAKNLTATLTAGDKTYDGNNTASITNCTLNGVVGSDVVTCAASNAHFASANADASAQTVTADVTLGGAAAGNYTVTSPATTSAKINQKPVTASITANDKTYDGTDTATVGGCSIPGKVGSDDVSCLASHAKFASANASAVPQTITADVVLTGTAASNYTLGSNTTASTTATINKATPSVAASFASATITYDGNAHPASATVSGVSGLLDVPGNGTVTIGYTKDAVAFAGTPTDAASYTASAHFTSSNPNYTDGDSSAPALMTIGQASSTTTVTVAGGESFTYDGNPHPASVAVTGVGGLNDTPAPVYSCGHVPTAVADSGCTASYTFGGDANHTGSSDTKTYTIAKADPVVTAVGGSFVYDATPHAGSGTARGVKDEALTPVTVAYKDSLGALLTSAPVNAGSYQVAARFAGDGNYNPKQSAAVTLTIDKASSTTAVTVAGGESFTYDGNAHPATVAVTGVGGLNLSPAPVYSCGHAPVDVADSGCTASYTFAGDDNHNKSSDSKTFTIHKATPTVTVSFAPISVTYDANGHAATATVTGVNGGLTIPGDGAVTTAYLKSGVACGLPTNAGSYTATATFTSANGNYTDASSTIAATLTITKASQTIAWSNPAAFTYGTALSATQLNATVAGVAGGSTPGGLTYTPASGTVLHAGAHQALTVTAATTADYEPASATVYVDVNKATQVISWSDAAPITYGIALSATQLNAIVAGVSGGSAPGTLSYSPAPGTGLHAGAHQPLAVVAAETTDYESATMTVYIDVNKATQLITWTNPAAITYGTPLSGTQLNATVAGVAGGSTPGAFTYTPAAGTTLQAGGHQPLAVVAAETADYKSATATVYVDVNKADQVITWAEPASIVYGMPLSTAQLNATVAGVPSGSAPGALTYSPVAGTVLPAGTDNLRVDAAATTNYNAASKTVNVNVVYSVGTCLGQPGHQILQPINADGTSVAKKGSTVPAKFRVCDAAGNSVGTPGVVSSFQLVQVINGTVVADVTEDPLSTTPDAAFRWDATDRQWIFNISTKNLTTNKTYKYEIKLNDGGSIVFQFGTK